MDIKYKYLYMHLYMLLEWTDKRWLGWFLNRIITQPLGEYMPFLCTSYCFSVDSSFYPLTLPNFSILVPVLGFTPSSCLSCHDLFWSSSSIVWPWPNPIPQLFRVTHSFSWFSLSLGLCTFALNLIPWGFWLLLSSLSLLGQFFSLGLTLMFPSFQVFTSGTVLFQTPLDLTFLQSTVWAGHNRLWRCWW